VWFSLRFSLRFSLCVSLRVYKSDSIFIFSSDFFWWFLFKNDILYFFNKKFVLILLLFFSNRCSSVDWQIIVLTIIRYDCIWNGNKFLSSLAVIFMLRLVHERNFFYQVSNRVFLVFSVSLKIQRIRWLYAIKTQYAIGGGGERERLVVAELFVVFTCEITN